MKAKLTWQQKMKFLGEASGQTVSLDAKSPIGDSAGASPKELVVMGIAGCTGMDVAALMRKHKQEMKSFEVDCEATTTTGTHPTVFKTITVNFRVAGQVDPKILLDSITLSQTKYCGVSAMIAKTAPIHYTVELNGEKIGDGISNFE